MAESSPPVAGFWSRVGALIVDVIVIWLVFFVVAFVIVAITGSTNLAIVLFYIGPIVYYVWGWSSWSGGQTLGKRALNLRVVNAQGNPLSKMRALGRLLASLISALPLGLGYLWAAWDPGKQTWHDKIVGSYVVNTTLAVALAATSPMTPPLGDPSRAPCPRCGESIARSARMCRYCGVEFEAVASAPRSE